MNRIAQLIEQYLQEGFSKVSAGEFPEASSEIYKVLKKYKYSTSVKWDSNVATIKYKINDPNNGPKEAKRNFDELVKNLSKKFNVEDSWIDSHGSILTGVTAGLVVN
jgi:hypothetical protein